MSWYKAGTVAVTNGSTTVTGTGTDWFSALQNGWGFVGPDGLTYEIQTVNAADQLTLATPYRGATAANQSYSAFPTRALEQTIAERLVGLTNDYGSVYNTVGQGRFPGDVVFDNDRDTGLTRPAINEVGLKAGDDLQLALKGGQARGAAVVSNPGDDSDGKLLTVGYLGIGGAAPVTDQSDFNNMLVGGFHTLAGEKANGPSGTATYAGTLQVIKRAFSAGASITQIFSSSGVTPTVWIRVATGDPLVWSEWDSVLPQRGSNANGEFMRFGNGTQICWHTMEDLGPIDEANGNVFRSERYSWTFPATFVGSPPVVQVNGFRDNVSPPAVWAGLGVDYLSSQSFWLLGGGVTTISTFKASLMAVGRWK